MNKQTLLNEKLIRQYILYMYDHKCEAHYTSVAGYSMALYIDINEYIIDFITYEGHGSICVTVYKNDPKEDRLRIHIALLDLISYVYSKISCSNL